MIKICVHFPHKKCSITFFVPFDRITTKFNNNPDLGPSLLTDRCLQSLFSCKSSSGGGMTF